MTTKLRVDFMRWRSTEKIVWKVFPVLGTTSELAAKSPIGGFFGEKSSGAVFAIIGKAGYFI